MSRLTCHGPSRVITRAGAIGYDPDTPVGSVPDPTDYADDAGWFYPVAITAPEELLTGSMTSGHSGLYGFDPANPSNALDDDHDSQSTRGSFAGSGGATIDWWWQRDLGSAHTVYSIDVYEPDSYDWWIESTSAYDLYVEGSADGSSWTDCPYTETLSTFANNGFAGGTRIKYVYTLDTPTSFRYWRIRKEASTVGFEAHDAMAEMKVNGDDVQTFEWFAALAANDDDNDTFDVVTAAAVTAADGVFLRGIVTPAVILLEASLRLALEDAGSTTIDLEGANESDFSDAVVLDSVTFTATGSFTAQTITFDLPATDGYTYLRFVLTSAAQDVWVHEVTLTAPSDSDTHSHVHDHDDDYLTVRYGGGDVLSTVLDIGSTETIDLANGNVFQLTLNANCTFTFTGADAGRARSFRLYLWQDETGGWDVTWPASVEWAGGEPILDDDPETLSVFMFETLDGGTVWHGYAVGGNDTSLRWEPVTHNPGSGPELVWDGDDLVMEFKEYP